jgi:UDP-N-acetylglucosamine 2-epimerase (non-hydrolysing)
MRTDRYRVVCVVGARPNFMKIAPLLRAFRAHPVIEPMLVHTGQHYDYAMNEAFFSQLGIPAPDASLEVGSGSHAQQTAEVMKRFEPIIDDLAPACVLVVGDVNSTIACALVAAKKGVPVVHVEAGLRSRDRSMPEEINRILTDQLSDRLYVTEREGIDNLVAEGIAPDKVCFAGNVMIDTLRHSLPEAVSPGQTLATFEATADRAASIQGDYAVLTLHRPSNVDDPTVLTRLLETLTRVSESMPIVFPVHPRTQTKIREAGLGDFLALPGVLATGPLGYFEMLGLMRGARVVLTDSGGLQEETTALGVPCLTLRENTERPITITQGTNTLVGTDSAAILRSVEELMSGSGKSGREPEFWDGHAAQRIAADLLAWLESLHTSTLSQAA